MATAMQRRGAFRLAEPCQMRWRSLKWRMKLWDRRDLSLGQPLLGDPEIHTLYLGWRLTYDANRETLQQLF